MSFLDLHGSCVETSGGDQVVADAAAGEVPVVTGFQQLGPGDPGPAGVGAWSQGPRGHGSGPARPLLPGKCWQWLVVAVAPVTEPALLP